MRIRAATADDADAICAIHNQGIEDRVATLDTTIRSPDGVRTWLAERGPRHPVIVADADGSVVGWGSLNAFNPRTAYDFVADFSVYVERLSRGQGIGRRLLDRLIELARAAGYHKMVLAALAKNDAGVGLYTSAGFTRVGIYHEQGLLDGKWVDVVIMEKLLQMRYHDRADAGQHLATQLTSYADRDDVVVLALPRGGVPVAFEIARRLHAPLDVFLVRKLGVPGHPELAMGAIASGGVRVLSHDIISQLVVTPEEVEAATERERIELDRRDRMYRSDRPPTPLAGRTAILVDDGLATGATMEAAIQAVRQSNPARVVVAAPVGAAETCERLRALADEVVCASMPDYFQAVGLWYDRFDQTSDEEVIALLNRA